MIHRYRQSGILVESALPLPEWSRFYDPPSADVGEIAEATIEVAVQPMRPTGLPDGTVSAGHGWVRFDVEGVGRWLIAEGRRIVVEPSPASDRRNLRLFTLGLAWAVLGNQRGWLMAHGSAVRRTGSGKAVLLTGASGQGKSTSAAALVADGWSLLADDVCRFEPAGQRGTVIHPSATFLKLWSGAVETLGWADRVTMRDYYRTDKFLCRPPEPFAAPDGPVPLGSVVVLEWADDLSLQRLRGVDAVAHVLSAACYRPQVMDALNAWPQQTAAWLGVLGETPVYRLRRPKDWTGMTAMTTLLGQL